jgi:hypothetical protein
MFAMLPVQYARQFEDENTQSESQGANSALVSIREEGLLVALTLRFAQADTRPATVFCDELDAGLF